MESETSKRRRSPARSTVALGLAICGLVLGGLWAMTLIGLGVDLLTRPFR